MRSFEFAFVVCGMGGRRVGIMYVSYNMFCFLYLCFGGHFATFSS